MNKDNFSTISICFSALFLAMVFVVTRFVQIPIPLGYFTIANCIILFSCILLPSPHGIIIGSIGSALADLTSYPIYTLPTLIIKLLMPLVYYQLSKLSFKKIDSRILAAAISMLLPLFGYTIAGGIIYGSLYTGLAQFPGLACEYLANLALFIISLPTISKLKTAIN